jgi:hypothetical protein
MDPVTTHRGRLLYVALAFLGIGASEKTNGASGGGGGSRQQHTCTGGRFDPCSKVTTGSSCKIASRHTGQTGEAIS